MQQNTQNLGATIAPPVGNVPTSAQFAHYTVASRTTSQGIRAHTVKTKSAHIANLFFGAALDFDDEPMMGRNGGTYTVYFYANDSQCDTVIAAATGGKA